MDALAQRAPQLVVLEGPLKKRGGTMPVMHDRYCVATWEPSGHTGAVVLRTYKSRAAYAASPQKPVDAHTLKCVSEWDGKGNFHKYPFGFVMETSESKLLMCAAPTREAQRQWLELLTKNSGIDTTPTAETSSSNTARLDTTASHSRQKSALFTSDDDEEEDADYGKAAAAASNRSAKKYRDDQQAMPHAENDLLSSEDDDDDDDGEGYESGEDRRATPVSPLALSPPDDKLLFRAGSSESLTSSHDHTRHYGNDDNEPEDWGIYGDAQHDGPSRYDVVDGPLLSLDTELLQNAPKTAAPLASDDFLFEQNGPTFGAVVVPTSTSRRDRDGSEHFVDPVRQERLARKQQEKQRQRVTKKLESNRDLYAEMAAARLKSMRKDAKTKPRPSVVHRRRGDDDEDDDEDYESWSDGETVDHNERSRAVSAATETSRISKSSTPIASPHEHEEPVATPFELEEIESDDEPFIRRRSLEEKKQKKKKSKTQDAPTEEGPFEGEENLFGEDLLFGDASMPVEAPTHQAEEETVVVAEEQEEVVDEEEARRRRREKRRLKRQQQEAEEAAQYEEVQRARLASIASSGPLPDEPVRRSSMDDQWQRATESQKRKDERRRARKEKARKEAEAAAAAEELARQQREERQRLEEQELKQERRERRERKKQKEKIALEKKAKELKRKETELLAEADKLKQTQEALLKADEIKDVSRKTKRRDKYTRPTDRIQRRDKEIEAAASNATAPATASESDMSTALVVVETPPSAPAPAMVSTATETEVTTSLPATAAPISETPVVIEAPVVTTAPVIAPVSVTYAAAPAPDAAASPQSAGETPVAPAPYSVRSPLSANGYHQPGFYPPPGYPTAAPQIPYSMPMPYAAPYSAVHYTPGFPAVPYGPGVAMPTPYFPHLGYVGGIAPMSAPAQMQAYAMMQPPSSTAASMPHHKDEDERFIGPQLPSPKSISTAEQSPAPASTTSSASVAPLSSSKASLPDLPDVAAF